MLSLINIGSTVAFNIINSVGVGALMISYIICIGCLVWRKITKRQLLPTKYPVGNGSFGLATNCFALCFLVVVFIFSFCESLAFRHYATLVLKVLTCCSPALPSWSRPQRCDYELGLPHFRRHRRLEHPVLFRQGKTRL